MIINAVVQDPGVYIFLFDPPPGGGAKIWGFEGLGKKNDYKPKQKKEKGRKKRKKGKEKKEKGKKGKEKEKKGKKKKEEMFFCSHRIISQTFLGKKKHIFSPGGKNIIYFWDVNVFIIGPKCNTSGEKYKFELKNLIKNSNRNAWKAL